jgi:hypothetical protein
VKETIQKITSLFFLLLGSAPWLFIVIFFVQEQHIRHEMEERLEDGLLQCIEVGEHDVHWVKKGKEISVHGRMFDIRSSELKEGTFYFTGLYDDDETDLKKQFNDVWNKRKSPVHNSLAQFLSSLQLSLFENNKITAPSIPLSNVFCAFIIADLPQRYKTILTPPPRFWS